MKLFWYITLAIAGTGDFATRVIANQAYSFSSFEYWAGRILILLDAAWVGLFLYLTIKEIQINNKR